LVFGLVEEAEREGIGLVAGAELDFDRLADELGERLGHFAVEDEGGVGVEFFRARGQSRVLSLFSVCYFRLWRCGFDPAAPGSV